jgi:predicted type IV restriction endonuclease
MMKIDSAHEKFLAIRPELEKVAKGLATESDTRLQVIDRVLIEVLGWPRDLIKTEPHGQSGYVDYLLRSPDRALFVVEAKRHGTVLADTASSKLGKYRLGGKALNSAQDGIAQARRYCFDHGVMHAALTSGFEWIAFTAIRTDGREPGDGTAIVFPSLSAIEENFAEFHDLFSGSTRNCVDKSRIEPSVIH